MKKFVFYTFEGYTESPTGETVENIQLLGFEKGESEKQARENLINNRKWIEETGFDKYEIESKQLLDDKLKALIKTVIDYNWESEQRHYEEAPEENHIFLVLEQLKEIIDCP